MHPQTWTSKDCGKAAVVVSYHQSYNKTIAISFCTAQNRNPIKPQV